MQFRDCFAGNCYWHKSTSILKYRFSSIIVWMDVYFYVPKCVNVCVYMSWNGKASETPLVLGWGSNSWLIAGYSMIEPSWHNWGALQKNSSCAAFWPVAVDDKHHYLWLVYRCTHCSRKYSSRKNLQKHHIKEHPDQPMVVEEKDSVFTYSCAVITIGLIRAIHNRAIQLGNGDIVILLYK